VQVFLTDGTFVRNLNMSIFNQQDQQKFFPTSVVTTQSSYIIVGDFYNNTVFIEPVGA